MKEEYLADNCDEPIKETPAQRKVHFINVENDDEHVSFSDEAQQIDWNVFELIYCINMSIQILFLIALILFTLRFAI